MQLLQSRQFRFAVLQLLYVLSLSLFFISTIVIAKYNLEQQKISSGFDFLFKSTGWELTFSLFKTSSSDPYWWFILMGMTNTLLAGSLGLILASAIGVVIGVARLSSNPFERLLGTLYVQAIRNVPLILQLFFWYAVVVRLPAPRNAIELGGIFLSNRGLFVPSLNVGSWAIALSVATIVASVAASARIAARRRSTGLVAAGHRAISMVLVAACIACVWALFALGRHAETPWLDMPRLKGMNFQGGFHIQPELFTLILAIAIYGGAYVGEIVRGGFLAVPSGQVEAARSLGLGRWLTFRWVQFPLALRAMLPMLVNQYIWLVKATTLGIVVGFADLFMVIATAITQSGQTLELVGILMAGFLAINITLATVGNRINRAVALKSR